MPPYQRETRKEEHSEDCDDSTVSKRLDRCDCSSLHLVLTSDDAIVRSFLAAIVGLEDSETLSDSLHPEGLHRASYHDLNLLLSRHFGFLLKAAGSISVMISQQFNLITYPSVRPSSTAASQASLWLLADEDVRLVAGHTTESSLGFSGCGESEPSRARAKSVCRAHIREMEWAPTTVCRSGRRQCQHRPIA